MSTTASLSDLAQKIESSLEELSRPPRTFADRVLASSADLILAIAFFSFGLTANLVASAVAETQSATMVGFVSAFVGLVVLKFWGLARERESVRDELNSLTRDARLAEMIVELTVEALEKPGRAARGGASSGEAASRDDAACPVQPAM